MVSNNSERAMLVLALGCMYTAVISVTVGSIGKKNGWHLREMDSRFCEQCM